MVMNVPRFSDGFNNFCNNFQDTFIKLHFCQDVLKDTFIPSLLPGSPPTTGGSRPPTSSELLRYRLPSC
ncbi:hypothetical protein FF1_027329 [Malus domestica]